MHFFKTIGRSSCNTDQGCSFGAVYSNTPVVTVCTVDVAQKPFPNQNGCLMEDYVSIAICPLYSFKDLYNILLMSLQVKR